MKKRIYLSSPHMGEDEIKYVEDAFYSNWIAPVGPNLTAFEEKVAELVEVSEAAGVSSGTAALHLALKAVGVEKGDVVFCSTLTFVASCNPILYEGATPVFIDSDYASWNMSPLILERALYEYAQEGKVPKAVIVVNLYGQSADYDEIQRICRMYDVPIIEDAAESLGATYRGKQTGSFGKYGIFSFNGNKIITTSSGGMVVSNDLKGINKIKFWASQSREKALHYQHQEVGYNYRMSNVLAGIGRGQLKVLQKRIEKKKWIYETYKEAFNDIKELQIMPICSYGEPNYWLSVMTIAHTSTVRPYDIMRALKLENIESRPVWKPMHIQPLFQSYPFYSSLTECSVAEDLFNRGICLPSDTKMTEEDIERVIGIVRNVFEITEVKV